MSRGAELYTHHFGLAERPFTLLPDPSFLYWSAGHRRAFSVLEYGIASSAPITLITGEIGAGKTMLVQYLLNHLGDTAIVGLVSNAQGRSGDVLRWVMAAVGLAAGPEEDHVTVFGRFQTYLIDQYAAGRKVVLIFDEAQNLSREGLEELRMYVNINTGKHELLQLVLFGQPEILDVAQRPDHAQFAQRVAATSHLSALSPDTVKAYIGHRLTVAGAKRALFTPDACDLVAEATGGIPRLINQLCDLSLIYAFTDSLPEVPRGTVRQVLDDDAFFSAQPVMVLPSLKGLRRKALG